MARQYRRPMGGGIVTTPVLPLHERHKPPAYVRLYAKARVYKVPGYGWVWKHECDHAVTKVSPRGHITQALAFGRAWQHMRRCTG